ncbi:hypothetical protein H310_02505 [Aphanomyces invadans]|uniref:Uncharacterized protein n=1 Tax=Aphanomyces invadans TaxID=157072 RepID=A0A024URB7_9STRA|nr:hypothetical protein H310_02505 [Aphanomyces invadans]ETW08168.1 hypothetical protein H310_02505 [Aphanomyces invadans]|eukprot:XP_008864261.1 hypothetical protein H310_02505 [Aphanomyces invadans]
MLDDDTDSFGPMKLTFDSTPPRKPKSSQPPGLLSHFKAKKTPTGGSAQKALSFKPPSFPQEENQDETDRLPPSTFASSVATSTQNNQTPSLHFKSRLHLEHDTTPAKPASSATVPSSHFKKPKTPPALPADTYHRSIDVPSIQSPQASTVQEVAKSHFKSKPQKDVTATHSELSNLTQQRDLLASIEQPPPTIYNPPNNVLRKSPTIPIPDDEPAAATTVAACAAIPSASPSSLNTPTVSRNMNQDTPTFPRHLQESLRQHLDEAIYTSKFSLAGARVVFADIPSHLPLAPQKAIYWLAKANVEEQHKAWTTAADTYKEALLALAVPLERLIVEAAFMEFQSRLQMTQQPPMNIVVPNQN